MKEKITSFLKKYRLILIISVSIVGILTIISLGQDYYIKSQRASDPILVAYPELAVDNVFEEISFDDYSKLIGDETTFCIYFGREDCPSCQLVTPYIDVYLKSVGIDKMYYVDTSNYYEIMSDWSDNKTNDYIGTPAYLFYIDGVYQFSNQSDEFRSNTSVYDSAILAINEYVELLDVNSK